MSRVSIIGNNALSKNISDGGRIKIRLFKSLLEKCGFTVNMIDLNGWTKRFLSLYIQIKKAVKNKDTILIMAGPNGCRAIIPLVNFLNRKIHTRTVFCPLGIGTVDKIVRKLTTEQVDDFINQRNFYDIDDSEMAKELSKLSIVLPENERLYSLYKNYYKIDNIEVLYNLRDFDISTKKYNLDNELSIIYASRICVNKGILDLMQVVHKLNQNNIKIKLDVYGDVQLYENYKDMFDSLLDNNVSYKGTIPFAEMMDYMKQYDIFCLPTKYYAEGTSGSLVESMIAGTPALISSYSQASLLIDDKKNGYIFELGNNEDMYEKIKYIAENKNNLETIGKTAQESAKKYLFIYNKDRFVKLIMGSNE